MIIARTIAVAASLAVLMASGGTFAQDSVPKDVTGRFPAGRYLHMLGTGESPEQASEAARLEIAKYFEAKISGRILVEQWAKSTTSRGKTIETSMTEISNAIVVGANRDIPGIEIALLSRNRPRNVYEAWAVLDKDNYTAVLGERIRSIDSGVDDRLSRNPASEIDRLQNLSAVMQSLMLRARSRQDLLLLNPAADVVPRDDLLREVMSDLDSLVANAFDVGVVFNGAVRNEVRSGIVRGAVDAGIRIREYADASSAKDADADLLLLVEHDVSHRETSYRTRTFSNVDWTLSVRAADPSSGAVIDAIVLNDSLSGAQNEAQAEERMIKRILSDQAPRVSAWIYNVIFKPDE